MNDDKFDVIVIGSGPGGYVASIRCAQLGMKTACIEKGPLGGTCLNVGCIPSKALLHSSELYYKLSHHYPLHGIHIEKSSFDFRKMMQRKKEIVTSFNQGIAGLFKKNKITHIEGLATFNNPHQITVSGRDYESKNVIIATGSEPVELPFLPIDEKKIVTSTGALCLETVPQKMLVIGAGVIGVELGSVYGRLGAEVIFIEFLPRICPTMDETISSSFQKILEAQGMHFHLSSKVIEADISSRIQLTVEKDQKTEIIEGDVVLCSIGRRPYIKDLGLEKAGIKQEEKGFIAINGGFQTNVSHIYAIGDVVNGPMLAHKAMEEGIAVAEIIFGQKPQIEYIAIPNVVYTDPEIAAVGLTEQEAKQFGLSIKVGSFPLKINSRAKCTGETEGLVKVIAEEKTDRLLGIHILSSHASEIIAEAVLALENKLTALELANTPHAHPTLSEAVKEAALAVHGRPIHR